MSSREDAGTGGVPFDHDVSDATASAGATVSDGPAVADAADPDASAAMPDATALDGLLDDARVPLDEIYRALERLEERTRALGDSSRSVHRLRHRLARQLGHTATAQQEYELWLAAPRDLSSGCFACERGQMGDWHASLGEEGPALDAWEPVASGSVFCDAEPHGVLARSLLPLMRLGRAQQAASNHVEGYLITRLKPAMCAEIGAHIEFCALTGNAARGLELLAEHGRWLLDRPAPGRFDPAGDDAGPSWRNTGRYADFLGGVSVLLRHLRESGFDDLPFAIAGAMTLPLGELREEIDGKLSAIAARFDERNGTTAFSSRILHRRSRQPCVSALPLDARSALPDASTVARWRKAARVTRPRPRPVEDLVVEARRLTRLWHPDALQAWQRAQQAAEAGGRALDDGAGLEFDEQRVLADGAAAEPGLSTSALSEGVAAAVRRARLLEIAERYRAQGRIGRSLHAASRAAFEMLRSGQIDAAASDQAALRLAAADALTGREITPDEYLAVRIGSAYQKLHRWQQLVSGQMLERTERAQQEVLPAAEPSPWFAGKPRAKADPGATREGGDSQSAETMHQDDDSVSAAARDVLAEAHDVMEECRRFAADHIEIGRYGAAVAGMAAHVRLGLGAIEAAERDLRLSAALYHESGAPWCAAAAESRLGRQAFARGDLATAERCARAAVEHELDVRARAEAAMLLAEALRMQRGREGEAAAPALAAAEMFARRQGADDDVARARLRAAESLAAAGRAKEAVALFEPALKAAEARWDQDEWKLLLAQAWRTYGNSLIAIGEPRRAAEVLSATANRVKDWPGQRPHAMLAADAANALDRAGDHADAAAAFERAADLWQRLGERLMRVRCLRSAAWSLAAEDLEAALGTVDGAGRELIAALAAEDADAQLRRSARYELAETHLQRAGMVLNLGENRLLAASDAQRLLVQAHQHATAAVSGLRRLIAEHGDTTPIDAARIDTARIDTGPIGTAPINAAGNGSLLDRLAAALLTAARIEGGHLNRPAIAAARLREWAGEFESWDRPELASRLSGRARKLLHPAESADSSTGTGTGTATGTSSATAASTSISTTPGRPLPTGQLAPGAPSSAARLQAAA